MKIHFNVDPNFLGAEKPGELAVSTYAQMYEIIDHSLSKMKSEEEFSSVEESYGMMADYLSEIKPWELSSDFRMMRDLYVNLISESLQNLKERNSND